MKTSAYPSFPASRFGPPAPRLAGATRKRDGLVATFAALPRREVPPWVAVPDAPGPEVLPTAPSILFHQARFHLGDTLWATPLFAEIARRWPGAAVTVVGPPVAAEVLAGVPGVVRVIPYLPGDPSPPWPPSPGSHPPPRERGNDEEMKHRAFSSLSPGTGERVGERGDGIDSGRATAEGAGVRGFDAALFAFARRPESRWLAEWTAAAGVPFRVNLEYVDPALDGAQVADFATHEGWFSWGSMFSPRMLLHLLDPLVPGGGEAPARVRPCFAVTAESRRLAAAALAERGIGEEPFAVLAPGGSSSPRWPAERFASLAARLAAEQGLHVLVEGSAGEADLVAGIAAIAARASGAGLPRKVLAATDTLGVLAALLERARLLVGNDSGPIHLADAVGTPTLYLAERQKLVHSHPESPACWALWDDVTDDPAAITVEQVMGAVREMVRAGIAAR